VIDPVSAMQGIQKIATIVHEHIFAQCVVDENVESQNYGINKGIFESEANAIKWLKNIN
jgi:hypothetical protein